MPQPEAANQPIVTIVATVASLYSCSRGVLPTLECPISIKCQRQARHRYSNGIKSNNTEEDVILEAFLLRLKPHVIGRTRRPKAGSPRPDSEDRLAS